MSVYSKEQPDFFRDSLESIFNQTVIPAEIVLVQDGPLTLDLDRVISDYYSQYPALLKIVKLKENMGLGIALNNGLRVCTKEIVMRMDSDDICVSNRFEKLFDYLKTNIDVSVVGSIIEEFRTVPGDTKAFRKLPTDFGTIIKFAKFRNPLNHPSVAFRKKDVLQVGGYKDMPLFEDYYLWVRLLMAGFKIANVNEPLLYFRTGNNMVGRRHGVSYLKKEARFLKTIKNLQFISTAQYLTSLFVKAPLRIMPRKTLEVIYKTFLR